jgi:hypothetical protein
MGQTPSTDASVGRQCAAAATDDEHCCRISSQKCPPLELRCNRPPPKAVAGTCFVYFHTEKAVSLCDYIRIRCTFGEVCSAGANPTHAAAAFQMSALKFDNEVVHLGETYYQFKTACTPPSEEEEEEGSRLLVRTRKHRHDGADTDPIQSASLMAQPRRWTFVWERCVRHDTKTTTATTIAENQSVGTTLRRKTPRPIL